MSDIPEIQVEDIAEPGTIVTIPTGTVVTVHRPGREPAEMVVGQPLEAVVGSDATDRVH